MLLSDGEIREAIDSRALRINPFDKTAVQPASYDVTLGDEFMVMQATSCTAIYPWDKQDALYSTARLSRLNHFILHPGDFCLATTDEWIEMPADLAAQVGGKSSIGRLGLMIHVTAGFIDPGFHGKITLELSNVGRLPIALEAGMKIGQLQFIRMGRPAENPYSGKYQRQKTVTESKYHLNYED